MKNQKEISESIDKLDELMESELLQIEINMKEGNEDRININGDKDRSKNTEDSAN